MQLPVLPQPALPSTDVLRSAALAKSWQRDRNVGTRREFWRWLLWATPRYILPVFACVILALSLVYPFWDYGLSPEPFDPPVFFRLDKQLNVLPRSTETLPELVDPISRSIPSPVLVPDNWLHSQEP